MPAHNDMQQPIDARGSQGAIIDADGAQITQNFYAAKPTDKHKDAAHIQREWLKCSLNPIYFVATYVQIYNATLREWIPFHLWPAQVEMLKHLARENYLIVLKARQLGMSWLCLAYPLWLMIFRPAAAIMLFSKRDEEALELRARVGGMYQRLPQWMQAKSLAANAKHEMILSNGSSVRAFPTTGGRSYTGSYVLLDEADFIPDLQTVLNAIKPTVDAGAKLVIVSTVDKRTPTSAFKNIFRAAERGETTYKALFFPWSARPDRTPAWYARIAADMRSQAGGSNDDLYQEYPATVNEALAPLEFDKRLPYSWLNNCFQPVGYNLVADPDAPAIEGLRIYAPAQYANNYVIGADPAEGNPNSDGSDLTVLDADTWEQCATLSIKAEPTVFADYIAQVARYYNDAPVLPERNNHGHTLIVALHDLFVQVMAGLDGKPGWLTNVKGKPILYNVLAESLRTASTTIRDRQTFDQLASIEASTLSAPAGLHDDSAMAFALAIMACSQAPATASVSIPPADPLAGIDSRGF